VKWRSGEGKFLSTVDCLVERTRWRVGRRGAEEGRGYSRE